MDLCPSDVSHGVGPAKLGEGFQAEAAGVAATAGAAVGGGVVATVGQAVIDPQLQAAPDDLVLGQGQQRGVDAEPAGPLDAGLGGQVGQGLEGVQVFGAAVGVARVIDAVDPDE